MPDPDFSNLNPTNPAQYGGPVSPVQFSNQEQPVDDMYEQLAGVIRDMKCVMKNFKVFFSKYLQPEENHFQKQNESKGLQNQQTMNTKYSHDAPQQDYNHQHQQYYDPSEQEKVQISDITPPTKAFYDKQDSEIPKQKKKHNFGKFKKQKTGDPNKPKAPLTPYFMFFQQNRDILRSRYPEMSLAQIGSLGGKIWRCLSQDEKNSYRSRYDEEMKVYKLKMRGYKSSAGFLESRIQVQRQYHDVNENQGDMF